MEAPPELNQSQTAEKYGVSPGFLSKVLKGTKAAPLKMWLQLWHEQGVTMNGHPVHEWRQVFRVAREELGMSQEQLAEKMGYSSRASIWLIETGRTVTIPMRAFRKLVNILNIKGIPSHDQKFNPVSNQQPVSKQTLGNTGHGLHMDTDGVATEQPVRETTGDSGVQGGLESGITRRDGADQLTLSTNEVHRVQEECTHVNDQ